MLSVIGLFYFLFIGPINVSSSFFLNTPFVFFVFVSTSQYGKLTGPLHASFPRRPTLGYNKKVPFSANLFSSLFLRSSLLFLEIGVFP